MKRTLFFFLLLTFLPFASVLRAQAPQAVTLQSVLRDAAGRLVANRNVSVLISLRRGSNTGTVVYSETHTPTTNQNGLYTVFFGRGTAVTGSFAAIDWALGPYYATVEADPTGGSNYTLTVSHPIVSVPYALFADTAAHAPTAGLAGNASHADTADYYREEQRLTIRHDTIHLSGGRDNPGGATWVKLPHDSLIHVMEYQLDSLINRPCVTKIGSQTITRCDSYTWPANQTTYTGSGVYTHLFPHATTQHCDSLALLVLTINRSTHNVFNESVVGFYVWHGTSYSNAGTYTYSYNNIAGCASVDTLKLKVNTVGALPGVFSVSATKKVRFSMGNLYFKPSTGTWQFTGQQYNCVGNTHANYTTMNEGRSRYDAWMDLFGWGTSYVQVNGDGYNNRFEPWRCDAVSSNASYNTHGYGPSTNMLSKNLTGASDVADWGVANRINNGGYMERLWRTLTSAEWQYLFETRTTNSTGLTSPTSTHNNARFCHATVCGVCGIILFPDNYTHPAASVSIQNLSANGAYAANNILATSWTAMQAAGAVFLPACGYRNYQNTASSRPSVSNVGSEGRYWSSTYYNQEQAYFYYFSGGNHYVTYYQRYYGSSVRLVQDVN